MLHERELIHIDEPVATFIPEFAKNGKHRITISDVLTHRSGIPNIPSDLVDLDFDEAASRLSFQSFVLEAAQQSLAKIANLSLFNFLR